MVSRIELGSIPVEVREVVDALKSSGYRAVLVGGSVRDLLLGRVPKDFDVATSATPQDVIRRFKRVIPTGVDHGTVTVIRGGCHVEVTTFRAEAEYLDGRRPSKVEFHEDVEADLSRRDFTINAMAYDPAEGLIDPFGGEADLSRRLVRCVRDPIERFQEDGLRSLRAVRFATVLDFAIDPDTEAAISPTLAIFRKVALERVNQELVKILLSDWVTRGLELLRRTGLLETFLPEARADRFASAGRAPAFEVMRLAILLDGAPAPGQALLRLKFPNKVAEETDRLVAGLALPPGDAPDGDLRRWLQRVEPSRLEAVLAVNAALGRAVEPQATRLRTIVTQAPPLTPRALALDGKAIMSALAVPPSPVVGEATRFLLDQVLDDPTINQADTLLALLKGWKRD